MPSNPQPIFWRLSSAYRLFLIGLLLSASLIVPSQKIDAGDCTNPAYALVNPNECGINPGNPYCKDKEDCGIATGQELVQDGVQGVATTNSLTALILGFVRFFLGFLFLVSVVALIYAGVLMVTALGDEGKVKKGKTIITWVIGGIVVIFLAYAIVNTVLGAIS